MPTKPLSSGARPSQDFVPIEQVRDGMLILHDGSIRAVLMASSINIVLKSEDEQAAILGQFKNFLNSLDFSIQIFIQSRELDIRPYLALLEGAYKEQHTELMKIQVREYIDFVSSFVDGSSIMTKSFYLVIPYSPPVMGGAAGGIRGIMGTQGNDAQVSREIFEEYRSQMEQRVSVVINGLARTGVRAVQLGTEETIELFYRLFNIGELDRPLPVGDFGNK
ncbi:MAG: hypothetical protein KBD21_03350 [Candidatus Pacebacteria bacterium]|nr:hypothetical protein [Candidatus Paceibacterota bacterium]